MTEAKLLELQKVTKTFKQGGDTITALSNANFAARAGEVIGIVGPSGSGKSTLLTIAGALQTPTEGKVIIDSADISELNSKQLAQVRLKKIGFILQASNLVPFLTVRQQLELHNRVTKTKLKKTVLAKLLRELSITKLADKYPADLSGGEKQRVAIAKILYSDPEIILADEPTASLDTKRAFEVMELLKNETKQRNKATIVVTHDERLLTYCDAVYEMHDGKLSKRKKH